MNAGNAAEVKVSRFKITVKGNMLETDPEMARTIARFSPVAWQHISFIGKYEFFNRGHVINIQEVIEKIITDFKIDISAVNHEWQGLQR